MNSKLDVKNEKMRVMALLNKWSRLIYGITKADRIKKRSFELCVKWASLSRKLVSKNKSLGTTLDRWKTLVSGLDLAYPAEF